MSFLDYVHITQGTASTRRYSNGNTLPLTQLPFAMNAFAPQTQQQGCWYFHPNDRCLEGVRLTHQPSPWIGDFGTLIMLPQAGDYISADISTRWSGYRPNEAILKPHYLKLNFLRSRSIFELVPTERGAIINVNYSQEELQPYFSILRYAQNIEIKFDEQKNRVFGNVNFSGHNWQQANNFKMFFVFEFDGGFSVEKSIDAGDEGYHIALNKHCQTIRMATSYISYDLAVKNLENEISGKTFEELYAEAESYWEKMLGRIEIDTEDELILNTFYSCLYRAFLFPNKMYEMDDNGNPIHYDVYSNSVKNGYLYTNNGFWDTYRTVYPLLSLVAPEYNREILKGYLQCYLNYGWLPRWNSLFEVDCMPGTLIDAVIADGAVKQLLSEEDLKLALEGMLKHAEKAGEGFCGRSGLEFYLKNGYVPRDIKESVNCTQDYAYGDFCIAQVAKICGKDEIAKVFENRSKNYKNLFDPKTGFLRSRDRNGDFSLKFNPCEWGGDYTEGSAWQNSFAVFHDFEGLAQLYGGKEKLEEKLDELFSTPPIYSVDGYGFEIHEMTEMAAIDFGQCAISNQPSFHLPWIYAVLGKREKAAFWTEKLVKEAFTYLPDGFPGDEDNGTMASWYIFSVMGFYPICPGKAEYVRSKQLVKKVKIRGKEVPNSSENPFYKHTELV